MNRSSIRFSPDNTGGGGTGGGGTGGDKGGTGGAEDFKFTVPQGVQVEPAFLSEIGDFAKKGKYTKEQAQGLFDRELAHRQKAAERSKLPDKYNLKAPQGTQLEQAVLDDFEAEYKALGLPQDMAEKLFARDLKAAEERTAFQMTFLKEQQAQWKETLAKHPEFGGDKLPLTAERSRRALERFAPPQIPGQPTFQEMLAKSTLGDHPYFVAFTAMIGAAIEEGKIGAGTTGAGGDKKLSPMERLKQNFEKSAAAAKGS